jgi:glycine cleavage system H protein
MSVPADLSYTQDHEWLRFEADGTAIVGITDYAQDSLGDITYVELPEAGQTYSAGETFGVVESVKAASDLFMPVDGEVVAVNSELDQAPEKVNQAAFGDGWMIRIKPSNADQVAGLLTAEAYTKLIA